MRVENAAAGRMDDSSALDKSSAVSSHTSERASDRGCLSVCGGCERLQTRKKQCRN